MIHVVRVTRRAHRDPAGEELLAEIRRTLGRSEIGAVRTVRVYRLEGVSAADAERLARELLVDPVDQRWSLNEPLVEGAAHVVEVRYLPGVMNPEAASILKAARDLGVEPEAVDSSREYAFFSAAQQTIARAAVDEVVGRLLANPTIERVQTEEPETLRIEGQPGTTKTIPLRDMDDEALLRLSAEGLHLDLLEMQTVRDYFDEMGRDPTDLELEALAQTWSEHCVHKTFKSPLEVDGVPKPSLMERLKETSARFDELVVSAFVDNSGVMRFYDGWALAGKVETHNSPSAIEPYGGAMTGSGGVFRDILGTGQGAKVVASTDVFCFAPPDLPAEAVPPGALPPDYLLRHVVAGVRDYGNRMGIPTNNGSVHFHPDFRAKPTVIVGGYGLLPEAVARKGQPRPGDRVLALGGRTGRDGIHGATFSSVQMTAETITANSQAVQIGNAVEEKRLLDAVLECREAGLIRAITDCGAGGFSSAVGEMGEPLGVTVHLERAPLKYAGLAPWEVFLSESQERMVLAVDPQDVPRVLEICATYNVEATDIGIFEDTGRLRVLWEGETVGDISMTFLHDGLPQRRLQATWSPPPAGGPEPTPPADAKGWTDVARRVLAHPNVCSKEPIVRQYDHTVQGSAVLPPYGGAEGDAPGDAAIIAPLLGQPYGMVIAHGLHPVLNTYDPYWGSVWAAAEAMSNLVAVGGNPREASLIDNFIWPVPEPAQLGALDRAIEACVDVMEALERPFISGKDSLSSTYRYPDGRVLRIPPVLCVSVFGRIPDVHQTVGSALRRPGSRLVLVGARDAQGLGGSAYLDALRELGAKHVEEADGGRREDGADLGPGARRIGRIPRVDLSVLPRTLEAVHAAIVGGQVLSCHDISEGGLLTCAAEMGFGGDLGVDLDLSTLAARGERLEQALFAETAGVFLIELAEGADPAALFGPAEEATGHADAVGGASAEVAQDGDGDHERVGGQGSDAGVPWAEVGRVTEAEVLRVARGEQVLLELPLATLQEAWEAPMRAVFH